MRKQPIAPNRMTLLASSSSLPSTNFCAMTSPVERTTKDWTICVRSGRRSSTRRYVLQRRRMGDMIDVCIEITALLIYQPPTLITPLPLTNLDLKAQAST